MIITDKNRIDDLVKAGWQRKLGLLHYIALFAISTVLKMLLLPLLTMTAIAIQRVPFVVILWVQYMVMSISRIVIYSASKVVTLKIRLNYRR